MSNTARKVLSLGLVGLALMGSAFGCASTGPDLSLEDETAADAENDDTDATQLESIAEDLTTPGPCAGTAMDRAVRCAKAKGARVLSFYRSPKDQERVRRENGCTNRCTGQAGCVRPTAGCNSSRHTTCGAVDLVNDGAPASRTQLKACGLAKTTAPHRNHYDLVR
jgi:hypothetical protein